MPVTPGRRLISATGPCITRVTNGKWAYALREWCAGVHDEASLVRLLARGTVLFRRRGFGAPLSFRGGRQASYSSAVLSERRRSVSVADDPYGPAGFDTRLDAPLCTAEFLLSGYVSGNETLSSTVKELQAGEVSACGRGSGRAADGGATVPGSDS